MKEQIQIRLAPSLRKNQNQQTVLNGYAAVFYRADDSETEFELHNGILERILPGAFDLTASEDVVALYSHDMSTPLGRTSAGTLRLSVDARGLQYEVDLPDTQAGRDVAESVSRGDITGSSFGFTVPPGGSKTRSEDGRRIREISAVDLIEVSPVVFPAYQGTAANIQRCANGAAVLEFLRKQDRKRRARQVAAKLL